MEPQRQDAESIEIGSSDLHRGILAGLVLMAAGGGLLWIWPSLVELYLILGGLWMLGVVVFHRSDRLIIDDAGLTVVTRRGRILHPWGDLLETGWSDSDWPVGCRLLVRRRGGPFDVPGPNSPAGVALLAIFRRARRLQAREAVRRRSETHGVPFSDRGRRMLLDPPPGSPYR